MPKQPDFGQQLSAYTSLYSPGFHDTQQYLILSQGLDTCYRVSRVQLPPFP